MNNLEFPKSPEEVKAEYLSEAKSVLTELYDQYKAQGILAFYLWGSITRDDWDPSVSDVDTLAIVDHTFDNQLVSTMKQRAKDIYPYDIKFGIQTSGVEELNGQEVYTTLGRYQPAGYLLLRFKDWIHAAGTTFERIDFAAKDFTPQDARAHQLDQSLHAFKIVSGELPVDPNRSSGMQSMVEDVVKGAIGALYWEAFGEGQTTRLNYDKLPEIVRNDRKGLATKLVEIRKSNNYTPEAVLAIQSEIESLVETA